MRGPAQTLTIAGRSFPIASNAWNGKVSYREIMTACQRESGAEIITVAVRRINPAHLVSAEILGHSFSSRDMDPGSWAAPTEQVMEIGIDGGA